MFTLQNQHNHTYSRRRKEFPNNAKVQYKTTYKNVMWIAKRAFLPASPANCLEPGSEPWRQGTLITENGCSEPLNLQERFQRAPRSEDFLMANTNGP